MIPYSRHSISQDDINAVTEVLKSDYLTRGPMVPRLEAQLAEIYGKDHCIVVANATLALFAALDVAQVTSVTSPTLTFSAIANAAYYNKIPLSLTDVDNNTLTANFYSGPARYDDDKPCFVPMDYAGLPWVAQNPIPRNRLIVVRDACHSFGAPASCFKNDDMTVVSGHAVKQLCMAEGGFILTDNDDYANLLRLFRDNGRDSGFQVGHGLNLHASDIHSAIGLAKLKTRARDMGRRWEIADYYLKHWKDDSRIILPAYNETHAWHLFVIRLSDSLICNRDAFRERLKGYGIGSQIHYCPLHLQPVLRDNYDGSYFPVANNAYANMLSIPLYSSMSIGEAEHVVKSVGQVLDERAGTE